MPSLKLSTLSERGVLSVSGPDSREFLQGLISNNINKVTPVQAIYAALLTPQGKYLFDFFIAQMGDALYLDCEKARIAELHKRLRMYKLRADVELADVSEEYAVSAIWGDDAANAFGLSGDLGNTKSTSDHSIYLDPRLSEAGVRVIFHSSISDSFTQGIETIAATSEDYDLHRISLGLPDATRDLVIDKSILLESGFDELNAIDWQKGCYMGQELTARTKYRGLVKKRLVPVNIEGPAPEAGTPIMAGDKNAGELRSSVGTQGIALLRLDAMESDDATFSCEDATLTPNKPDWATF